MINSNFFRALSTLFLVFGLNQAAFAEAPSNGQARADSLVVVKKIIGIDELGRSQVLYNGESGRIYRLDNIDQAVHDLNGKSIRGKGTYRQLQAVLDDTVYVMDQNRTPHPAKLEDAGVAQKVQLSVDNIRVTKDKVTAIYTSNCQTASL
ncbi:MAG: hypothetical protein KZQ77_14435 [Candidatus Thiodiazotropha sp. (ex Notomyrtea botanica)]|nr:hypothetical protein [Candidatus Thiodiazotropha sp. (ex Notomyrtea botanica)]